MALLELFIHKLFNITGPELIWGSNIVGLADIWERDCVICSPKP